MSNRKFYNGELFDIRTGELADDEMSVYTRLESQAWFDSRGKYLGYRPSAFPNAFWIDGSPKKW